jgi:hypothetical protein
LGRRSKTARNMFLITRPVAVPAGSGGNNNLSALAVSIGTLAPVFASGTTAYTVSVPNGVASLAITPTAANGGAVVSINGKVVASGTASGAVNLEEGVTTIAVKCNGGGADKTYTLSVTRAAGVGVKPPSPALVDFSFDQFFGSSTTRKVTVSNFNNAAMTITFANWNVIGLSWVTAAFPVTVPANASVQLEVRSTLVARRKPDSVAGGWVCGAGSGTMEARVLWT